MTPMDRHVYRFRIAPGFFQQDPDDMPCWEFNDTYQAKLPMQCKDPDRVLGALLRLIFAEDELQIVKRERQERDALEAREKAARKERQRIRDLRRHERDRSFLDAMSWEEREIWLAMDARLNQATKEERE